MFDQEIFDDFGAEKLFFFIETGRNFDEILLRSEIFNISRGLIINAAFGFRLFFVKNLDFFLNLQKKSFAFNENHSFIH